MIQVRIEFHGDPSVGINSYGYDMNIPFDKEHREEIRKQIKALYDELDGEFLCVVYFEDELKDTDDE